MKTYNYSDSINLARDKLMISGDNTIPVHTSSSEYSFVFSPVPNYN